MTSLRLYLFVGLVTAAACSVVGLNEYLLLFCEGKSRLLIPSLLFLMMEVEDYCNPSSVQTFLNNDCDGHSLSIERNAKDVPLTRSTQSLSTLYSSLEASVCASTLCLEGLDSKSSIYSD